MFGTRLISSIILAAVIITLGLFGGLPWLLAIAVISVIGMNELYKIFKIEKTGMAILAYILAAVYEAMIWFTGVSLIPAFIFLALLALLVLFVFTYPRYKVKDVMVVLFGLVYVTIMLSFMFLVRVLEGGSYLVWLIFVSAFGNDTMAYCTGLLLGKHKLCPVLSPKKSIEGFIGGIVFAGIFGAIYGLIFGSHLTLFNAPWLSCGILCLVAGAISVVGDLAASGIKRDYGIKDYGNLIPGHGGILDRFDSIIITAPIVFFMVMLLSITGK